MKTLSRERDKAELLRRLRAIRSECPARWGRMTAHQMVCHLADAFRMALGQKPVGGTAHFAQRTVVKWTALYLPLPWPGGIRTIPEIDQELGGTKPARFAEDAAELEALLEWIATTPKRFEWQPHPLFGRMSDAAWHRWAYLHTDHHLRQFGV